MSFSKPTIASMSRENATKEAMGQRAAGRLATITNVLTQLPRQFFTESAAGAPHVMPSQTASRNHRRGINNENNLQPRLQHTLAGSAKHARSLPTSPAMQEFTSKCDDVMQRAQRLLERTKDQEQLLLRAIEERAASAPVHSPDYHTQSPSTHREAGATEDTPQTPPTAPTIVTAITATTTTITSGWLGWSAASPAMPSAPPPTPASCTARDKDHNEDSDSNDKGKQDETDDRSAVRASSQLQGCEVVACETGAESHTEAVTSASPTPRPPHCPPPTPATAAHEGTVTPVRDRQSDLHGAHVVGQTPPGSGGGLFQRLFNSLQRLSGQPGGSPSPTPQPRPVTRLFSPGRKSVHFVSPDKLESVTPTKVPSLDEDEEAEEEKGEEEIAETRAVTAGREEEEKEEGVDSPTTDEPARKRRRNETPSQHRVSILVPPAPPPSVAKSNAHSRSSSRASSRTALSATTSTHTAGIAARKVKRKVAKKTTPPITTVPPMPPGKKQGKRGGKKNKRREEESTGEVGALNGTAATTEEKAALRVSTELPPVPRHSTEHTEMLEFILHHSVKECMARFTKRQLLHFLHADGVLCQSPARTKRELLDEVRAVCGVK